MSLELIKNLKGEVEGLKKELEGAKGAADKVAELEKEFGVLKAEADRKVPVAEKEVSTAELKEKAANMKLKSILTGRALHETPEYKELAGSIEKAIKPSDVPNWVEEAFANEILTKMELDLKVASLFGSYTIPENVQVLSVPRLDAGAGEGFLINPAEDAIESALTSGKVQFQVSKIKSLVITADETNQEAVLNTLMDVVKTELAKSLARGVEKAIVNADQDTGDDNINGDPAATDVTRAYAKGLRKYGLVNTVDGGGNAITLDDIKAARKAMGVFGVNPADMALIINPETLYDLLGIDEVLTVDKIGSDRAVLRTGTIASIFGINVIISEYVPHNLDANGKVASDGTLTAALLVHLPSFKRAKRNAVGLEQDRNIINGTNIYVGQTFTDFKMTSVAGNSVVSIINLA